MSSKLEMKSSNIIQQRYNMIKEIIPNAFTEVKCGGGIELKIDFDILKEELSTLLIDNKQERYQMTWPDKKKTIHLANSRTTATLRPVKEKSVDFDNTKNLYIEGDNLEVLKLLRETYLRKIKMIYIDPPYNTGNDFIYEDDFKQSTEDYLEQSGQFDEDGNRLVTNSESNGRFHTDWLNMMYARLKVARDLLTDDGVMLISIDDNEVDNLMKICVELFNKKNLEIFIWNKEAEGSSGTLKVTSTFRRIHEYILCVHKDISKSKFNQIHEALKGKENDFQTANLAVNSEKESKTHPNYYSITNPSGDVFTRQWKWNKKHIDELIANNLIYWGSDGHKQPRLIIPTDERRTTYLLSILNYGGTTVGRKDFEKIMGTDCVFSYPKPIILLEKLISSITNKDDIILDFFSGSATTAHAIMKLNLEDNGKRKYIMVQIPEKTDNPNYSTICDIGEERIRRAGIEIKEEAGMLAANLDSGFRVLKLDSSNMTDVFYNPNLMTKDLLSATVDNIKTDRNHLDLLFQVMLELGVELSSKIEEKEISGKQYFIVNENDIVACFDNNITEDLIKELAYIKPLYAVFRDSSFSDDSANINCEQIFKSISPTTNIKVL